MWLTIGTRMDVQGLAQQSDLRSEAVPEALDRYGTDPDRVDPRYA